MQHIQTSNILKQLPNFGFVRYIDIVYASKSHEIILKKTYTLHQI